jgi:hypothetical protein
VAISAFQAGLAEQGAIEDNGAPEPGVNGPGSGRDA